MCLHRALPHILHLVLAGSVVFVTGVLDDRLRLSAWKKLMGIAGAAVLAYTAGIRVDIHILHSLPAWPGLGFALTVIWLIGCTNAFNLIDGMDGLAAGVGLVATVTMLIAALTQGNLPLALATMPLAGCLLGFLRYNFNGASVFLGDSGSLLIGFLLGCYRRVVEREVGHLGGADGAAAGGVDPALGSGAVHRPALFAEPADL